MSIADKIKSLEEEIVANKDKLTDATKTLEEAPADEAALAVVEELSDTIETQQKSLSALKKAEAALASKAVPVQSAPAIVKHRGTNVKGDAADLLFKSAVVALESGIRRVPHDQILAERYPGNDEVKAVSDVVTKAAVSPAVSAGVPTWASDLVDQALSDLMSILRPVAIIPKLPMKMYSFDGYGSIKIPRRNTSAFPNDLSGAFRAEAAPIRVSDASIGSITLTEKSLGVISTYSEEILRRSTQSIEALIRDFVIQDTSEAMDKAFIGATAASAIQPAGILNGVAGNASVGATVANIQTDLKTALGALAGANLGANPYFIMHPLRALSLQMALTATGALAFPSMQNNMLYGANVVVSTSADPTVVILVDASEIGAAFSAPEFSYSYQATLHMENQAPAAIDGATPVRSLFQTATHGLRMMLFCDWAVLRTNAVQSITAVAW